MIRSTPEGSYVWFQLDVKPELKITWPVELFILYSKESKTESELRLELWEKGEISNLTDQDRNDLRAAMSFKLKKEKSK